MKCKDCKFFCKIGYDCELTGELIGDINVDGCSRGEEMKVNRIKKTAPKKGRYWCYGCDRAKVRKGEKCPICGQRDISKHQKP